MGFDSNARHSGGTVIPFLNFSVPYAALLPIFEFASKGKHSLLRLVVAKCFKAYDFPIRILVYPSDVIGRRSSLDILSGGTFLNMLQIIS